MHINIIVWVLQAVAEVEKNIIGFAGVGNIKGEGLYGVGQPVSVFKVHSVFKNPVIIACTQDSQAKKKG